MRIYSDTRRSKPSSELELSQPEISMRKGDYTHDKEHTQSAVLFLIHTVNSHYQMLPGWQLLKRSRLARCGSVDRPCGVGGASGMEFRAGILRVKNRVPECYGLCGRFLPFGTIAHVRCRFGRLVILALFVPIIPNELFSPTEEQQSVSPWPLQQSALTYRMSLSSTKLV